MRKTIAAALFASALAACTATDDVPVIAPPPPPPPPQTAGPADAIPTATRPQDMQGTTILDVRLRQPQAPLAGCEAPLPIAETRVAGRFGEAIAAAQAYSEAEQGVGLMIVKDGAIVHESYALGADERAQTTSASMMKSVLGLVVGIAIEDGVIGSVDDPIGTYIAEWRDDPRGQITLEHLLQMASGLAPVGFSELLFGPDIDAIALSSTIAEPAGTSFYYNNAVSQIVGVALDRQLRATGTGDFIGYLQEKLWCPVGNGDANLWVAPANGHARYYAGMLATLEDWARIGELIRNDGMVAGRAVVPAQWIAAMAEPSATNPRYGYQLWLGGGWQPERIYNSDSPTRIVHSEPYAADDVVFFDGFGGQRVYVIASKGLTIARTGMVNMAYDDAKIVNLLVRALDD